MPELQSSEEICEALVRHLEVSGSEVFEKNFKRADGRIICAVWCIIGDNAEAFTQGVRGWLKEQGFNLDAQEGDYP